MYEPRRAGPYGRALALLMLGLLGTASCGHDEHYTGLGDRATPGDPLWSDPALQDLVSGEALVGDTVNLDPTALQGKAFRLTNLRLSAPLDGKLGDGVNKYFTESMAEGSLNVLIAVDEFDGSALALRMGGAQTLDGVDFQFSGTTASLACAMDGRSFSTQTGDRLEFPNTMLKPPIMPLEGLALAGVFSLDGQVLTQGVMEGTLTLEDAASTKIMGVSLKLLLESMKRPANADLDGNGSKDGWLFSGTFEAKVVQEGAAL